MSLKVKTLRRIIRDIDAEAEAAGVKVHPSFGIELVNYSQRIALSQLFVPEVEIVLHDMASRCIAERPLQLDANSLKKIAADMCDDPWGACDKAAAKVLTEHNMHDAVVRIKNAWNDAVRTLQLKME